MTIIQTTINSDKIMVWTNDFIITFTFPVPPPYMGLHMVRSAGWNYSDKCSSIDQHLVDLSQRTPTFDDISKIDKRSKTSCHNDDDHGGGKISDDHHHKVLAPNDDEVSESDVSDDCDEAIVDTVNVKK
jgi:hypothetical protein